MKTRTLKMRIAGGLGVAAIAAGLIGGMLIAAEKTPEKEAMTAFMRTKLAYTQGVTEGMTMEQFGLVMGNAIKLRDMTQSNVWVKVEQPDYKRFMQEYQSSCEELFKKAGNKDLDAVTEAYAKVLKNCVECHRVLRAKHGLEK